MFPSSGVGQGAPTQLGALGRADLKHWWGLLKAGAGTRNRYFIPVGFIVRGGMDVNNFSFLLTLYGVLNFFAPFI